MRNIILVSLLLVACGDNKSKLDESVHTKNCGDNNRALRFIKSEVESEAKAVDKNLSTECEEYYCDEGQLLYSAVRCELSNGRRVWASTDAINGPSFKWLGEQPEQPKQAEDAPAPAGKGPKK